MPVIKLHEKALAHLSRGLYRSPASALRELVTNAWDANATEITIDTNFPFFAQVTTEDNGDGLTRGEFELLMEGGIGNSRKRSLDKHLINNRPIVGRYGIGMLGIAQFCGSFIIMSRPRVGEPFRARVHLYDLLKTKLDEEDPSIVRDYPTDGGQIKEVDIGHYMFEDMSGFNVAHGTRIIAEDVHPTFTLLFKQSLEFEKYKDPPQTWAQAIDFLSKVRTLQELGDYWRFLWELSASCPVPYISTQALPNDLIVDDQARLLGHDFQLIVDGLKLLKPVHLHDNPEGYTTKKISRQVQRVYGNTLAFGGYIAVQESLQLKPDELRGIMIRIKDIGIGYYDGSFLDYRFNEGPRSRWLTGEIYVDQGLENALNIDRDSFNRFHPEYRAVQKYIHDVLHNEVFPATYKNIDKRSTLRAQRRETSRTEHLKEVMSSVVEKPVELVDRQKATAAKHPLIDLNETPESLKVEIPLTEHIKTKKAYQQLATSILSIFEVASLQETPDMQREVFRILLLKLLQEW
jgi:hypothetical protein